MTMEKISVAAAAIEILMIGLYAGILPFMAPGDSFYAVTGFAALEALIGVILAVMLAAHLKRCGGRHDMMACNR